MKDKISVAIIPDICLGSTAEFKKLSHTFSYWICRPLEAGAFILFMQMEHLSSRGAVPSVYAIQQAIRIANSQLQVLCLHQFIHPLMRFLNQMHKSEAF